MKPMEAHYDERLRELAQGIVDTRKGLPLSKSLLGEVVMVIHILEDLRDRGIYKVGAPSLKSITPPVEEDK